MDKRIATEIVPHGLDSEIITYLESNVEQLGLTKSIFYYGFPVFKDYEDTSVKSKFCILSQSHGIVLINTTSLHEQHKDDENLSQLFSFIESALKKSKTIRINKKKLAINIESYLFISNEAANNLENEFISSINEIKETLNSLRVDDEISEDIFDEVRAIIEGSKALTRASKRTKLSEDPATKLNILIELEKEEIRRKYEKRKTKIDELMNQVDGKIYSDTIITSEKIYLKNDVTTNNENVDYLTEMFGIPTSFTMLKSCCLEINLNEKTWRYMFDHEVLYQNYNFIDLPTLKQIIRNKNIENLLKN